MILLKLVLLQLITAPSILTAKFLLSHKTNFTSITTSKFQYLVLKFQQLHLASICRYEFGTHVLRSLILSGIPSQICNWLLELARYLLKLDPSTDSKKMASLARIATKLGSASALTSPDRTTRYFLQDLMSHPSFLSSSKVLLLPPQI